MKAINLLAEALRDPLGLGERRPRLSWNAEGGVRQEGYRVLVAKNGVPWIDTGKILSSSMHYDVPEPLSSRDALTWKVFLYEEGKEGPSSDEARLEIALLDEEDFKASWIRGDYRPKRKERRPVDCFRRKFSLKDVRKARLYITACGLFEAWINGKRVGDEVLSPGHTDYRKRIHLSTFDVGGLLQDGENVIEVFLADGWFRGSCGAWGLRNQYGKVTRLFAQLEIETSEGKKSVLTDSSWDWSADGPIRFADNKDGEVVDARLSPTYSGKAVETSWKVMPTPSDNVPIREKPAIPSSKTWKSPSGKTLVDFGQNIAGFISFRGTMKKGQELHIRAGELIGKDGELTLKNIQCATKKRATPLQEVHYTAKEGLNEFKNRFSIFGFQYIEVTGDIPEDFSVSAVPASSDFEDTLSFESSNPLLDKFVDATRWSARNNGADVPTDCPTRERHGWTGDSQLFFRTASYLFDYRTFARKHLRDVYDWQEKNGRLPQIAPAGGVDFYMDTMNGAPGWADAGILIPWRHYLQYGDERILKEFYPGMKRYAEFIIRRMGKKTLLSKPLRIPRNDRKYAINYGQAYGEWAEPKEVHATVWTDMILPKPEVATAYASLMMDLIGKIASIMEDEEAKVRYEGYRDKSKAAYQAIRKLPEYSLDTDRQALLVRPLMLGLLGEEESAYAKKRLVEAMEHYRWRVGTGFLSTPFILYVLEGINPEYAYRVLENEEMPGWLFMAKEGATTIWESWEGTSAQGGIASLDHYSKGAVLEWVFSRMCGVRVAGENRFLIAPVPGGHFERASLSYRSVYGIVRSSWRKEKGRYFYEVEVPANCEATFRFPSGRESHLLAGKHILEERA